MRRDPQKIKVGIAGMGAIGRTVARALTQGLPGYELVAASEPQPTAEFKIPYVSFDELASQCDLVIESLPPSAVPDLAQSVFMNNKDMILVSTCALLMHPGILDIHKQSTSRILVPSGALAGLDGIKAMAQMGIQKCSIASTKHPNGFSTAPYVLENSINVDKIDTKTKLFSGNALEASRGFPANINVAATLSIASKIAPEKLDVEIWADPLAKGNTHEVFAATEHSELHVRIMNRPDPENPKTSALASQSIIALLKNRNNAIAVL